MKGQSKSESRSWIASLLEEAGIDQAQLANELGVAPSLVSLVTKGEREPSTKLFLLLGKYALERNLKNHAEWFLKRAGISGSLLDILADERIRRRPESAAEFMPIAALDPKDKSTIPFPARFLNAPASTRFLRVPPTSSERFKIGEQEFGGGRPVNQYEPADILLIDPLQTDLREIDDGKVVAFRAQKGNNSELCVGTLSKDILGSAVRYYWLNIAPHAVIRIGLSAATRPSDKGAPLTLISPESAVLGRVLVWISHKESDKK